MRGTFSIRQSKIINDIMEIANDGTHPKQTIFYDHVIAAIVVPTDPLNADPCPTRLLSWSAAGAKGPGGDFKLFKTFLGQDFYAIP